MNDGGPAFPLICQDVSKYQVVEGGMSMRDWFAGMALSVMLHQDAERGMRTLLARDGMWQDVQSPKILARIAYEAADAMLAEREKRK